MALIFFAVASAREGESQRVREKRQEGLLASLSDADKSQITELSAQGMSGAHIRDHLGLASKGYVDDVLDALKRVKPTKKRRLPSRYLSTPGRRDLGSRTSPKDITTQHRHRKRKQKRDLRR